MQRRLFALNDQKAHPGTNGGSINFTLRTIPDMIDGMYVHVAGFYLKVVQQTKQAASTASAVKGSDVANIVSKLNVVRGGSRRRVSLGGQSLRVRDALGNMGAVVEDDPADLAAISSGGAITTAQTYRVPAMFERRDAYAKSDCIYPAAAFNGSGYLSVDFLSTTAAYDSTITIDSTVSSTVDCFAIIELREEVIFGVDLELVEIPGAGTPSTAESLLLDAGDYSLVAVANWKFGGNGGDDMTLITNVNSNSYAPGIFPSLAGKEYKYAWDVTHGRDRDNGLVNKDKCLPLYMLSEAGKFSECARFGSAIRVAFTLSTAFTNPFNLLVERVLDREATEMVTVLNKLNIDPSKATAVSFTADGRPVQQKNEKFVPKVIVPGVNVPRNIRANAKAAA